MTDQHQTEAQRLAALLRSRNNNQAGFGLGPVCDEAAVELLRLNSVHSDLERVNMRLVACGVVAMADTPDSAKKARTMHPDYESASCDDVKRRVDECIELRARVAELEEILATLPISSLTRLRTRIKQLEEMLAAVGAGGVGPLIPTTVQHQFKLSSGNHLQRNTGDSVTSCSTTPAGWKLVPVEPTRGMLDAAHKDLVRDAEIDVMLKGIHSAMLAAAPQPPVVRQSDNDTVPVPRSLLGAACAAINRKQDAPKLLEQLRRYTTGDLSQPAGEQLESEGRQAFEAWCYSAGLMQQSHGIVSISSHTDTAWLAWQAAIANRPQQPRQPLTDEAVLGVAKSIEIQFDSERLNEQIDDILAFARAIERAHGIGGEA